MKLGKITKRERRRYRDACAAAHALDLVGERWTLLVIRELMTGPKRFSDIKAGLPGLSANVLTQRLETLESTGVLTRRMTPPPAAAKVYALTAWGYEAQPIFQALGRWGARSPFLGGEGEDVAFSAASFVLSVRTMFNIERAAGLDLKIGFRLGAAPRTETYAATVENGALTMEADPLDGDGGRAADAVLSGAPLALAGVLYGEAPLSALEADGAVKMTGDRAQLERFLAIFQLPSRHPPPAP